MLRYYMTTLCSVLGVAQVIGVNQAYTPVVQEDSGKNEHIRKSKEANANIFLSLF